MKTNGERMQILWKIFVFISFPRAAKSSASDDEALNQQASADESHNRARERLEDLITSLFKCAESALWLC